MSRSIDLIRWALKTTDEGVTALVEGVRHNPLTRPTDRGGNHPLWVMGHLAFVEGLVRSLLTGEPNPVAHWQPLFGTGTRPTDDASAYPPFDQVLATFRDLRRNTLAMLDRLGEADLDRPPQTIPPGFKDGMATTGRALLLLALHQMVHYGQIADARRMAGVKPLI